MIKQVQEWSEMKRREKREEKTAVLSEHVSTCVCVCDAVSRSETRLIRFCLIGAAPHGRVRQPFPKATTHTLFLLLWPWQTAWKAQIKKPIMLPWAAHRETTKSSCQNNREETKRGKAKREPPSLFKFVSESCGCFTLHCSLRRRLLCSTNVQSFHGNTEG